ncbi:MAG: ATP-binding protein [Negativicutes bacterium]|nr:ATP-binding protein [Negativicutes bacterium]
MRNSLQWKLLSSFMVVIIVILIGVSLGVSALIGEQILAQKQQELITKGYEVARVVDTIYNEDGGPERVDSFLNSVDSFLDARVWVLDKDRQLVGISIPQWGAPGMMRGPGGPGMMGRGMPGSQIMQQGGMRALFNDLDSVYEGNVWTRTFDHPFYGEKMLVVAVPIKLADGSVNGVVMLNAPVTGINEFMRRIYFYIGITGFVAVVLALLVVTKLTRGIVRPLRAMQETADAMARGDYSRTVKVESKDEVGNLGLAINSLSQDLARYMAELDKMEKLRREFVANVSHELRTPITILRGYNEALMDGTIDDPEQVQRYYRLMQEETVRLERLIKDLLDLSRLQNKKPGQSMERIPLAIIAKSVSDMLQQQAVQKQISLFAVADDALTDIMGDGDRITQLLLILTDNALKYTPAGGKVMLETVREHNSVALTVADSGIGIPADDLPYIWERFYKVDKSHSREDAGVGLGLAIAKEIIDLHGADVEVKSQLGKGTAFTIKFPVAKACQQIIPES